MNDIGYFHIADTLGISLNRRESSGILTGEGRKVVKIGDLELVCNVSVTSNYTSEGGAIFVIAKIKGNLALLLTFTGHTFTLHYLDRSKMPNLTGVLDTHKPKTVAEGLELLGPAIVKSFFEANKTWQQAA